MQFICYSDWSDIPASIDNLFAETEADNVFFSREWFEAVSSSVTDKRKLLLACVVTETRVEAVLPLIDNCRNNFQSLKHRYSTHYSFLLSSTNQALILDCLVKGLTQLPLRSLLLEPVSKTDSNICSLRYTLESAGYETELIFRSYNWIYRVEDHSFMNYLATRPSSLRNTLSRKKRKLDREQGAEIRIFTGEQVPRVMDTYYAVYTASWKANEQYKDFLDKIVASFSGRGWTRLAILYIHEIPVAAQLWFVLHGKASIFRLAYDASWKHYSPGSILTAFMMEYVIETDKVVEIDFLTGNDAYKQDWMSDRREHFALSCISVNQRANLFQRFFSTLKNFIT